MEGDGYPLGISNFATAGSRERFTSSSHRRNASSRRYSSSVSGRHSFSGTNYCSPPPSREPCGMATAAAAAAAATQQQQRVAQMHTRTQSLRPDMVHAVELADLRGGSAATTRHTGGLPLPARALPINVRQPGGSEVLLSEDVLVGFDATDRLRDLYEKAREAHRSVLMQFELRCDKQAIVLYGGAGCGTVAGATAAGERSLSTFVKVTESVAVVLAAASVHAGLANGRPNYRAQSFPVAVGKHAAGGGGGGGGDGPHWRGTSFELEQRAAWPGTRGGAPRVIFCVEPNVTVMREIAQRAPFSVRAGVQLHGAPIGKETGVTVDGGGPVGDIWEELVCSDPELEGLVPLGMIAYGTAEGMGLRVALADAVVELRAFGVRRVVVDVDHADPTAAQREPEQREPEQREVRGRVLFGPLRLRRHVQSNVVNVLRRIVRGEKEKTTV